MIMIVKSGRSMKCLLVITHTSKKYCQAQAQVRLSLRLTEAHSGSLWLSQALSGSYFVTLTL